MLLWFVHNEKDQDHIEFYLHFLYPVLSHFVEVRYLISQQAPLKWMLVNSKICHICHESKIIRCEKWRTKCMRRYHLKICLTSNTDIFTLQIILWLQFDCEEGCASHMDEGRLQLLISNGSWHIYSTDVHHVVCCIASDLTQKHFVLKHVRLTSVFGSLWFLSQSHQSHKITILSLWKSLGFANIQLADTIVLAGSSPKLYHPCFFHFSQQSFINLLSSWINCWGFQSLQWWCRGPSSPGLTLSSSWRRVRRRWSSGRGFQLNSQSCKNMFESSIYAQQANSYKDIYRHTHKYTQKHMCTHTHTHKVSTPEAHAEPQEAARAGNVGNPAHLLRLSEPLAVWLL